VKNREAVEHYSLGSNLAPRDPDAKGFDPIVIEKKKVVFLE
jgi:hypothetical protein